MQGYHVYRRAPGGDWEAAGTSPVAGWVDTSVQWDTDYRYRVSSYGFDLGESTFSDAVLRSTPAKPTITSQPPKQYLPAVINQ